MTNTTYINRARGPYEPCSPLRRAYESISIFCSNVAGCLCAKHVCRGLRHPYGLRQEGRFFTVPHLFLAQSRDLESAVAGPHQGCSRPRIASERLAES